MSALVEQVDRRLVTVARLFYEQQLSKTEIADRLSISVTHVNRLLKEATRRGIVEITIRAPRFEDLELSLRERYGLVDVRVVAAGNDDGLIREELGIAAAGFFDKYVSAGDRVGLGSGRTLFEMASAITERPLSIELFPLAVFAESTTHVRSIDSNTVVNIVWFRTRPTSTAQRFALFFPGDDLSALRAHVSGLVQNPHIQALKADLRDLDYYFLGCDGLRSDSQLTTIAKAAGCSIDDLKELGIVGDIVLNMVDTDGNHRLSGIEDVLFNIGYDDLQLAASAKKSVVLIAGGASKVSVIRGALRRRLLNSLITDSDTALTLLRS